IVSTIGGLAFTQPIVFRDELVYSSAAKAVVHGPDGVSRFAYGAYPLLIAPIYALLGNVQHAYAAIKIANGAAFALAAVPAYLLARRVAPATLALGVALLTVLLPARVYSYLVFSESVAFLLFLLTVLSLVRVLEAPTRQREFLTFVLALLAVAVRRQNVGLFVVTLAALTALLVEVAAFSSTPYGLHRIHERYLFYAAPLVFAMFALWTQSGCDTHIRLAIAAGVTALLPLLLPRHGIVVDGLDTPVLFALDFHPDSAGSHGAVAPIAVSAYLAAALVLARPR